MLDVHSGCDLPGVNVGDILAILVAGPGTSRFCAFNNGTGIYSFIVHH